MRTSLLILGTALVFAVGWPQLPSFDWVAALTVGALLAVAAVFVIGRTILPPAVPIWRGATVLTVATISLATGVIGGTVAGFYWGRLEDTNHNEQLDKIMQVSNQLDIHFVPSPGDPKRAADFKCVVIVYQEKDLNSRPPTITTRKTEIDADNSAEFFSLVEQQMTGWFGTNVLGDSDGLKRRVVIYMEPYPGEGICERLKEMAEKIGGSQCVVSLAQGRWTSALPRRADP